MSQKYWKDDLDATLAEINKKRLEESVLQRGK